ncbi:hypothetical protein [Sinosporangium siamense]|uniref:Uncharacterized protein n=1 Tax=Sinosporangium siamense TaxID=1367973 RepID=A0A919RKF1_9ACTN|nr:hypothetical protein [Sinosporangium siamense]GII95413.1 hypothetical protein Ssi02_56440 [Sinosporangium siamense]
MILRSPAARFTGAVTAIATLTACGGRGGDNATPTTVDNIPGLIEPGIAESRSKATPARRVA